MTMQRVVHKSDSRDQASAALADLRYWMSQPVQARLAALEALRRQMAGPDAEQRLQRVCRVTSLKEGS